MAKKDLRSYRDNVSNQVETIDKDIDTSLSYISIGALGFFLTINEKFLRLSSCTLKSLLYISVSLLLFSFIFILIKKYLSVDYGRKLITDIDNGIKDADILKTWEKGQHLINCFNTLTYIALGVGVILQIVFFLVNISNSTHDSVKDDQIIHKIYFDSPKAIDSIIIRTDTLMIY